MSLCTSRLSRNAIPSHLLPKSEQADIAADDIRSIIAEYEQREVCLVEN
jgi:hypothetical protein